MYTITTAPPNILFLIVDQLGNETDVKNFSFTCKYLNSVCNYFWLSKLELYYPEEHYALLSDEPNKNLAAKQAYLQFKIRFQQSFF